MPTPPPRESAYAHAHALRIALLLALLALYLPGVLDEYAMHDDLPLIDHGGEYVRGRTSFWRMHPEIPNGFIKGRPLQRPILALQVLTIRDFDDVRLWRIGCLAALAAFFLYSGKLLGMAARDRRLGDFLAFLLCISGVFQTLPFWVVLSSNFLPAATLSAVAWHTHRAGRQAGTRSRRVLLGFLLPWLTLMAAYSFYQPAAAFFLVFAAAAFLFDPRPAWRERLGEALEGLALMAGAMGGFYCLFLYVARPLMLQAFPVLVDAFSTVAPYQRWVFRLAQDIPGVLWLCLSDSLSTAFCVVSDTAASLAAWTFLACLAGLSACGLVRAARAHGPARAALRFIQGALVLGAAAGLSVAPTLVARGGPDIPRTYAALLAICVCLQAFAVREACGRRPGLERAGLLALGLLFVTLASVSTSRHASLLAAEQALMRGAFAAMDPDCQFRLMPPPDPETLPWTRKKPLTYSSRILPEDHVAGLLASSSWPVEAEWTRGPAVFNAEPGRDCIRVVDLARLFSGRPSDPSWSVPLEPDPYRPGIFNATLPEAGYLEYATRLPCALFFELDRPMELVRLLMACDRHDQGPGRMPVAWKVYGATQENSWRLLADGADEAPWQATEERVRSVRAPQAFRRYMVLLRPDRRENIVRLGRLSFGFVEDSGRSEPPQAPALTSEALRAVTEGKAPF